MVAAAKRALDLCILDRFFPCLWTRSPAEGRDWCPVVLLSHVGCETMLLQVCCPLDTSSLPPAPCLQSLRRPCWCMWLQAFLIGLANLLAEPLLPAQSRRPCPWASSPCSLCSSGKGPVVIAAKALTVAPARWCSTAGCVRSCLSLPEENTARAPGSSPWMVLDVMGRRA